jgi:hypothetical protein
LNSWGFLLLFRLVADTDKAVYEQFRIVYRLGWHIELFLACLFPDKGKAIFEYTRKAFTVNVKA